VLFARADPFQSAQYGTPNQVRRENRRPRSSYAPLKGNVDVGTRRSLYERSLWRHQESLFLATQLADGLIEPICSDDWRLDLSIAGQEVWASGGPSTTDNGDLMNGLDVRALDHEPHDHPLAGVFLQRRQRRDSPARTGPGSPPRPARPVFRDGHLRVEPGRALTPDRDRGGETPLAGDAGPVPTRRGVVSGTACCQAPFANGKF